MKVKSDAYNYTIEDIANARAAMDNHEKLIAVLFRFCNKMSCYGTVSSRGGMIISLSASLTFS